MDHRWTRRNFAKSLGILAVFPATGWTATETAPQATKLKVLSADPHNAEPPVDALVQQWVTPVEQFYIRTHGNTPVIKPEEFRLTLEGMVDLPLSLSLAELQNRFPRVEATCTMTCAGNRREEMAREKPIKGVQWGPGAIGNATWSGFRLSALLKLAGVQSGATHVQFEGLDQIPHEQSNIPFGASIPIEKALADTDHIPGAIVCDRMNGAPLTPDHGAPLRIVVPGYIGARSTKWVGRLIVSNAPSPNHFVADVYKLLYENTPAEAQAKPPILSHEITSAIGTPLPGAKVAGGEVVVRGYALPPGKPGVTISKVEVSADDGKTWVLAKLTTEPTEYCWQLWEAVVATPAAKTTLVVRAFDSENTMQPEQVRWNHKGYLYNAWHKVPIDAGT